MAFRRILSRALVFALVLGGLWAVWEGYKWLWERTGWSKPFRVDDLTLPHVHSILLQLGEPTSTGDDLWLYLLDSALFTARAAAVGFLFGAMVGFVLGVVLAHFEVLRRGVMPYVVASQTIPILALAPIVVRGLGSVSIGGEPPPDWVRVSGFDGDGVPVEFEATGWFARCMQHENDHLDGKLYVDRLNAKHTRRARKAVKANGWGIAGLTWMPGVDPDPFGH